MTDSVNKWYVKKAGEISGPFSKQVICNNLKLGRLSTADEISADKISWKLIQLTEHLFQTNNVTTKSLRLDERNGFDRRQSETLETTAKFDSRRQKERRASESYTDILRRQLRTELFNKYKQSATYSKRPIAALLAVVFFITLLAIAYPTKLPTAFANCDNPAGTFVDWSNCQKNIYRSHQSKSYGRPTH